MDSKDVLFVKDKIVSKKTLRVAIRSIHITGGALIAMYIYSPWSVNANFTKLMQLVVVPVLLLSGIAILQKAHLIRMFRRSFRKESVQLSSGS